MARTVTITANAYRPSEALAAVRREAARQAAANASRAFGFDVDRAQGEQKADDQVAIVVTRDSSGMVVPASSRRTYRVTFQVEKLEQEA